MCDSYIGLDQCYTVDLMQINHVIKGQYDQPLDYGDDNESLNYSMCDTEVESVMQPQNMDYPAFNERSRKAAANEEEKKEGVYQSLYMNGFTAFDQLQNDMVVDILSDDEGGKSKAQKKKEKEEQLQAKMNDIQQEEAKEQIDSTTTKGKSVAQVKVYNQIK